MTGVAGQRPMGGPCPRCTGMGGVHYLTCPTLRREAESCARCGRIAEGYARGREGQRLCHTDDRRCYRDYINEAVTVPP